MDSVEAALPLSYDSGLFFHRMSSLMLKNAALVSSVEVLVTGRPQKELHSVDVLQAARCFSSAVTDLASAVETAPEDPPLGRPPIVHLVLGECAAPLLFLSWELARWLSRGYGVLLTCGAGQASSLTAALLCQLCANCGLPAGALSFLPQRKLQLFEPARIDAVSVLAPRPTIKKLLTASRSTCYRELRLVPVDPGMSALVVCDSADLDAAADQIVKSTGETTPGTDQQIYADFYPEYQALYPALKDRFVSISQVVEKHL